MTDLKHIELKPRKNTLLDEIEMLRARVKELEAEVESWRDDRDTWIQRREEMRKERDEALAEVKRLRQEIEALKPKRPVYDKHPGWSGATKAESWFDGKEEP